MLCPGSKVLFTHMSWKLMPRLETLRGTNGRCRHDPLLSQTRLSEDKDKLPRIPLSSPTTSTDFRYGVSSTSGARPLAILRRLLVPFKATQKLQGETNATRKSLLRSVRAPGLTTMDVGTPDSQGVTHVQLASDDMDGMKFNQEHHGIARNI